MKLNSLNDRLLRLEWELCEKIDARNIRLLIAYELKYSVGKEGFERKLQQFRAFALYYGITTKRFMSTRKIADDIGITVILAAKYRMHVKLYLANILRKRVPRARR